MSKIEILVFFHILGAFLICGGAGVGMAAGIVMGKTTSVRAIGLLSLTAHKAAFLVTLPGSLLTLVTGTWLVSDFPFFEFDEFWLWVSYPLWLAAAALDHGLLGPQLSRVHAMAKQLEAEGAADCRELQTLANSPRSAITGMLLLTILIVFLVLMVFRPGSGAEAGSGSGARLLTLEEVAGHSTPADCWVVVDGLIYDITELLPDHSGSPDVLIPLCGQDATSAFEDKGGQGRSHTPRAAEILSGFQVGRLQK